MKTNDAVAKRRLRKALKLRGLTEKAIDGAIEDTFGNGGGEKLDSVPRAVSRGLLALFNKNGKGSGVTVTWGKSGKFRVYTTTAHKKLVEAGRKTGSRERAAKPAVS